MSTNYPNPHPGQFPPKKKTGPWVWVAVGVGAFLMIMVLVIVVAAFSVWYKVRQAGVDPEMMKRNPALAAANSEEGREAVTVESAGEGEVKVRSDQGAMTFRQGAGKTPDWAPAYPGASVEGIVSMQGGEGEGGSFHFTTKDPADKVIAFYETALKNAGMKVTSNSTREGGAVSGGMVMGEDQAKKRNVMATVGAGDQGTAVNVVFSTKD